MTSTAVKRQAFTSHLTRAINKLSDELSKDSPDENEIKVGIEQVQVKFNKVVEIANKMQDDMTEEEQLTTDIDKMEELENKVISVRIKAKSTLEKLQKQESTKVDTKAQTIYVTQPPQVAVKLPDAKLQEFHGDDESFPSFIDNFTALVDDNPNITDVEKFGYLRGVCKLDIVQHCPMTGANYKAALHRLKNEYGDEELIATKHLNALIDMNKSKKPSNNTELQDFFNFLETKLACLEALNRPVDVKNQMIVTLIYRQLPKILKKKIAKSSCNLLEVMAIIKENIRTEKQMRFREESDSESDNEVFNYSSSRFKKTDDTRFEEEESALFSSAAALPVLSQSNKSCVYCNSNHSPLYCQKVRDILQRREIVKNSNRCYNCLSQGHRVADCRISGRCRTCEGKHHSSLCNRNQQSSNVQQNSSSWNRNHEFNKNQQSQWSGTRNQQSKNAQTSQSSGFNNKPKRGMNNNQNPASHYQGVTTSSAWESPGAVLLQMAEAEVRKRHDDKYVAVNIFFDLGSQWSYCTSQLKESLNLESLHNDVLEVNTFGTTETLVAESEVVTLQITKGEFTKDITVHTTNSICNPLPSFKITNRKLQELKGVKLASPKCRFDGLHEISILVGADLYWEFVEDENVNTSWGAKATKSKLGWLLSGPISVNPTRATAVYSVTTRFLKAMNLDKLLVNKEWIQKIPKYENLGKFEVVSNRVDYEDKPVKHISTRKMTTTLASVLRNKCRERRSYEPYKCIEEIDDWNKYKVQNSMCDSKVNLDWFWETECIGILPEDREPSVWQEFQDKIKYIEELSRYEVELPCKIKLMENLPDNYHLCEVRLQSLLTKLNKPCNLELLQSYKGIIQNQLEDGIIEEVNTNESENTVIHHLSHHCVIRKDKPTTQVRMVLDGSAKANRYSLSLNQCLRAGPSLVNNLAAVLSRFRMHKIGIVADISKAFHQLLLVKEDRDLTRFLWRDNGDMNNPIKVFRFKRVPFGLTSSPFLLHATIIHHLEKNKDKYPRTIEKLLTSFYVDDLLTGEDDEKEAVDLTDNTDVVMKEASMELKKWSTNYPKVLEKCSVTEENKLQEESTIKLLGMMWNKGFDEFGYNVLGAIEFVETLRPSKRSVLKIIQKIYDPLGILSPYMISAKCFLQRLCKLDLGWDQPLAEDVNYEWRRWCADLSQIKDFSFPRCIKTQPGATLEIVGFCDASIKAYAAVVYLRTYNDRDISSNIVMAKSRVAPMKPLTIPRLELLGAVLLVRLVSAVMDFLSSWKFSRITYYTDSTNVLHWINDNKGTSRWNGYITRRLDEINTLSARDQWRHCKGDENPADFPTRGMTMQQLSNSQTWLHGPEWILTETFLTEENSYHKGPSKECLEEELKSVYTHSVAEATGISTLLHLENYSNLQHLYRVTAYLYMFYNIHIRQTKVSHTEMQRYAEKQWIKYEQKKYYGNVRSYLKGEISKPNTSLPKQIDLFLDDEDLIRCSGRFKYATLCDEIKYPILLPKESHLTTLIVQDRHKRVKHSGVKDTLLEVRENFWIPKGRRMIKSIIYKCVVCRRLNAKPFKAPGPPPLPAIRLSEMPPFTNTGVDFAGPLLLRERGCKEAYKAYIALYTCASARAVHLELVPSMSAKSFKNSLVRFVSTRGIPSCIISDNAKSFIKTAEDFNCLITRSPTKEFLETNHIHWLFYLEKSPWWGGFIERMVGSVKVVLRKILYRTFLDYDEMSTLLKEIESVINSRPITYVYSDEVVEPLTPSHLLIGKRSTQLPTDMSCINDSDSRNRFRERLLGVFEQKWKKLYLSELQDYHIITSKKKNVDIVPQIGEVVIIKDGSPRSNWKLGKVTNLHMSRDGNVRSVEVVKPNRNIIRRPPQLLIPLELRISSE